VVDIFLLVKDRWEFTEIVLSFLHEFTDFSRVHRLVFVNDGSTDGVDDVCHTWIRRTGIGEVVSIRGGSVTNALYLGTHPYRNDPVRWVVKLDNDLVLCEDWLTKVLVPAEASRDRYDVFGFTTVNEFFPSTPEEIWADRPASDYGLQTVPYTGGNFLMRWDAFLRTRHLGVTRDPRNYITGSISELHRALSARGVLRIATVRPHLPVFKLDKVAVSAFDRYGFFERRGLDRSRIESLVERYHREGVCRKRIVEDRVVNRF
jgi:hypothetical protein